MSQIAITVRQPYAPLIASGITILQLRNRKLLAVGQRVVVASDAPECMTVALVECVAFLSVADLPVARVLRDPCVRSLDPRWKIALQLKVMPQLPRRRVRKNFGVWALRPQKHSRDAGVCPMSDAEKVLGQFSDDIRDVLISEDKSGRVTVWLKFHQSANRKRRRLFIRELKKMFLAHGVEQVNIHEGKG